MPISKIGSKALIDCSVAAVDIADNSITAAKLAGTLDISTKTLTLPNTTVTNAQLAGSIANAKLANSSVTINSTSVSLGASANINALDWQSVIVADGSTGTTGVAGRGYFINTTSAAHTFTLPISATRGDTIAIKDYAATFATFNLTIARNGHKIQGVENNSLISTNRASVVLVYVDVTRGWEFVTESNVANLQAPTFISATGGTITTSGDFKIHTFTGDGCFVVSSLGLGRPIDGPSNVDYLVVAGGAGGGCQAGGGGGAGGYRTTFPSPGCNAGAFPIAAQTYPITVGGGGAGGTPSPGAGGNGNPSVFSTITSTGGGGGGSRSGPVAANSGGSGGGGGGGNPGNLLAGGSGNTPPTSPSQGNNGGIGSPSLGADHQGGGGGGAGGVGTNARIIPVNGISAGGNGGAGSANSITGSPVTYAGGGGGANQASPTESGNDGNSPIAIGAGGSGVGGNGAMGSNNTFLAGDGLANSGSGGGGDSFNPGKGGGAGGSGIVIIRYKFQ